MSQCIYCLEEKDEAVFNKEHVIPQAFGKFGASTPTLINCVCKECNDFFARVLDPVFTRDTYEGITRYALGIKSRQATPQKKIQLFVVASLIYLVLSDAVWSHLKLSLVFIGYNYIVFAYAYLLNSFTDREQDLLVGKNYASDFSNNIELIVIAVLGFFSLVLPPLLFKSTIVSIIAVMGMFLATAYSLRPLRFKERGFAGLFVATVIQKMPFIFWLIILPGWWRLWIYLFGWLLLDSFLVETWHQIVDYYNDRDANVRTFAIDIGIQRTQKIAAIATYIFLIYLLLPLFYITDQGVAGILLSVIMFIFSQDALFYARTDMEMPKSAVRDFAIKYSVYIAKRILAILEPMALAATSSV